MKHEMMSKLKFEGISIPMEIKDIPRFELQNKITVY